MLTRCSRLAGLGTAALVFTLAGCHAAYNVEVSNRADQPVTARLVSGHFEGVGVNLGQKFIGPGDHAELAVQRDDNETISLVVDFAGNAGQPAVLGLAKGKTSVVVRRTDQGSRGHIKLEIQP